MKTKFTTGPHAYLFTGMHCLFLFRFGQDQIDEVENGGAGILARGLYLVGAAWDPEKNVLIEADRYLVISIQHVTC